MRRSEQLLASVAFVAVVGSGVFYVSTHSRLETSVDGARVAINGGTFVPGMSEVTDVTSWPGGWAVLDSRSRVVHMLDSGGTLVGSFGRRGGGPGEFQAPIYIAATYGHIHIADRAAGTVLTFDQNGGYQGSQRLVDGCPRGGVAGLAAVRDDLYLLRRCLDGSGGLVYHVQVSMSGGAFRRWKDNAAIVAPGVTGAQLLAVPLFAVSETRVAVGDGVSGCLEIYDRATGDHEHARCFTEFPRVAVPPDIQERMEKRARGRVSIPEHLPLLRSVSFLSDGQLVVQVVRGLDTFQWMRVDIDSAERRAPTELSTIVDQGSFVGPFGVLVATEDVQGIRFQVRRYLP